MITFPCLAWKPLLHGSSLHSWPGGPAVGRWGDQLEGRACPPEAPPGVPAATGQSPGPPDCVGGVPAGLGVPTCPSALRRPQRWPAALWRGVLFLSWGLPAQGEGAETRGSDNTLPCGDGQMLRMLRMLRTPGTRAWGGAVPWFLPPGVSVSLWILRINWLLLTVVWESPKFYFSEYLEILFSTALLMQKLAFPSLTVSF